MSDSIRILVVEDDPDILSSTVRLLRQAGYAVDTAATGEEALQVVHDHYPGLLLLDHDLPGIDGMEVCRRIKRDPALVDTLVVIVSASHADSDEQAEGLESGADGYIGRPIANRELLARVGSFVRNQHLSWSLRERAEELTIANEASRQAHLATLNLMEEVVTARAQLETVNWQLQAKITERKQVEDELRRERQRLASIISGTNVGTWEWNVQTGEILFNERWANIIGYTLEELAPVSIETRMKFTHPDDLKASDELLKKHFQGDLDYYDFEARMQHKNGTWVWVLDRGRVSTWTEDGKPLLMMGTQTDITQRKQAEEERRRLDERMSQVQKLEAIGVLVAGVAHNINNVLAAIMGAASMREGVAADLEDLETYRIIVQACRRGRDVAKSLVQFSRPSLSNQAPLELHALITEVLVLLENTTRNRIKIIKSFSGEPFWINGDAGNLNHALMNLCINSLDAMPNEGTLTFRTTVPEKDWIELSVEDSGVGMTPEVLAHVFDPFFTTKEVGKGTGLGLSMTYGVIKAHGGTLQVSSVLGQGTIVKFRIPRIHAPALKQIVEAPAPALGPLTVLLVDDDDDVRLLVARMLKKAGLQIKAVASGEAALESLISGAIPDLVILDQNMPSMNGIQTMEKIRALHPNMRILISSGQPDIEEWACFKQSNVAVISKPFEMEEILAKLAQFALNPSPFQPEHETSKPGG